MWFRLSALWGCTVHEAQARCTSREFSEWMAFYVLEPWGSEIEWLRVGQLASVMANAWRGKGGRQYEPKDFVPEFGPKVMPSRDEVTAKALRLREALASIGALRK